MSDIAMFTPDVSTFTTILAGTPKVDAWGKRKDWRLWGDWQWVACAPEAYEAFDFFAKPPTTEMSVSWIEDDLMPCTFRIEGDPPHPYLRKGDIVRIIGNKA